MNDIGATRILGAWWKSENGALMNVRNKNNILIGRGGGDYSLIITHGKSLFHSKYTSWVTYQITYQMA